MDDLEDYDSLPESSTMTTHMLAGAAAGIMEHSIVYPVDCVKTRMQCLVPDPNANYRSMMDAFYRIIRYEGIRNTLRGLDAMIYGAGPAHAMYFACYEELKGLMRTQGESNHLVHGTAGMAATVLHDLVMNPADAVKQRMQVYGSPYRSCLDCVGTVYRTEGVRAFYRSFTTQLALNIPFQSLHFVVYEFCQDHLNHEREYNPVTHTISGGMAGAVAAGVTTPLDVCKTLLNTQEHAAKTSGNRTIRGLPVAIRTIYRINGLPGFFKGMVPRVVYQMPSTAIAWSVYEFIKYFLKNRQKTESDDGQIRLAVSAQGSKRPD